MSLGSAPIKNKSQCYASLHCAEVGAPKNEEHL